MVRKTISKARILDDDGTGGIEYGSTIATTNVEHHIELTNLDKPSKPAFIHLILLNRTFRIILLTAAVGICLPAAFYMTFYSREIILTPNISKYGTCGYYQVYHLPCGVRNISKTICELRGCCFMSGYGCYHSLPARQRYTIDNEEWNTDAELKPFYALTPLETDAIAKLRLDVRSISNNIAVVALFDPDKHEYVREGDEITENDQFTVTVFSPSMYVEVYRKLDNTLLFSTARGPLIATNNYLEWSFYLNGTFLAGLGQLPLEQTDKLLLMNNADNFTAPFVLAYNEQSENFHGIIFSADTPVEIEIMATKLLLIRSLQSVIFKIYILTGPSAADVYSQIQKVLTNDAPVNKQTNLISTPPHEFWHFGVHVCNEHEFNLTVAMTDVKNLLDETIPFDSHCIQDGLFWFGDDEYDEDLAIEVSNVVESLHENGKNFIASVIPYPIEGSDGYKLAEEMKLLLRQNDRTYVGQAFSRNTSYIDYTVVDGENTVTKWLESVMGPLATVSINGIYVQGAWMIDETVETKIPEENDKIFPYVPEFMDTVMHKLPPWNIISASGDYLLLYKHNTYASYLMRHICTQPSAVGKFCVSSTPFQPANYPSVIAKTSSTWFNLVKQIHQAVTASMAGIKWFGFPVCGSDDFLASQEELCIRWYQFSSLMPIFKVTAARFTHRFSGHGRKLMIDVIERRYSLLEYINTQFSTDKPLLRPLFFDFPEVMSHIENLTHQYMVGDSLMVVPVTLPDAKQVRAHFPVDFYELWGGKYLPRTSLRQHQMLIFPVVLSDMPLFIRAGHIIILRNAHKTLSADNSRQQSLSFKIALDCTVVEDDDDENNNETSECSATGRIIINGASCEVTVKQKNNEKTLTMSFEFSDKDTFCKEDDTNGKQLEWADVYMREKVHRFNLKGSNICVDNDIELWVKGKSTK